MHDISTPIEMYVEFPEERDEIVISLSDIHQEQYYIVYQRVVTSICGIQAFLIMDSASLKFNYYVLDYWQIPHPLSAEAIVKNCDPVPLSIANRDLPHFNLCDRNYGF